jgi:catechol 2,3-dioxygenase-like lactoylglutathione lyase family enzyme
MWCDGHMADFHHFGITVRDIERSFAFYTEVAGMSVWNQEQALDVKAPQQRESHTTPAMEFMVFHSDELDTLTDNPGARIKYVMLESADKSVVFQLTEYVDKAGPPCDVAHNSPGSPHLSFFVDDVDATLASVRARADTGRTSEVVQITPSMRSFYVDDPDSVPVEFIEVKR